MKNKTDFLNNIIDVLDDVTYDLMEVEDTLFDSYNYKTVISYDDLLHLFMIVNRSIFRLLYLENDIENES